MKEVDKTKERLQQEGLYPLLPVKIVMVKPGPDTQHKYPRADLAVKTLAAMELGLAMLIDKLNELKEAIDERTSKNRPSSESEEQGRDEN